MKIIGTRDLRLKRWKPEFGWNRKARYCFFGCRFGYVKVEY